MLGTSLAAGGAGSWSSGRRRGNGDWNQVCVIHDSVVSHGLVVRMVRPHRRVLILTRLSYWVRSSPDSKSRGLALHETPGPQTRLNVILLAT